MTPESLELYSEKQSQLTALVLLQGKNKARSNCEEAGNLSKHIATYKVLNEEYIPAVKLNQGQIQEQTACWLCSLKTYTGFFYPSGIS